MGKEPDYVAMCPACNHMVMWASSDLTELDPKGLARDIASSVKAGLSIIRVATEEARKLPFMHADDCTKNPRAKSKSKSKGKTPLFAD